MKKYLNFALIYALAAMAAGVFYREFTKWYHFTGETTLGKVHTHLFVLGMLLFMLIALFSQNQELHTQKSFCIFFYVYNTGLPLTVLMMLIRGITQVLSLPLSTGMNAAISGLSGIGHILLASGLVLLLTALKNCPLKNK